MVKTKANAAYGDMYKFNNVIWGDISAENLT